MMKLRLVLVLVLFATSLAATTLEFADPFNQPGDVIGNPLYFDIRAAMLVFNPDSLTAVIETNYKKKSLGPFEVNGVELNVGDLLFEVDGVPQFGVPLRSHGGLIAGHLYLINDLATGVLTAQSVLNYSGSDYRPEALVWLQSLNGSLTDITDPGTPPSVVVVKTGDGQNDPKYMIEIQTGYKFEYSSQVAAINGLYFASATCGNDIIEGTIPEPGTITLLGGGLLLAALLGRRFRRA